MPSVMAIVSKAIFDGARGPGGAKLAIGSVWPTDAYVSANKGLQPLAEGGDLYLVTVRPGDELWLVGVLRAPTHDGARWTAAPNTVPIRSLTAAIPALRFANGKGLAVKAGALGMSLQTPRPLATSDLAVLGGSAATPPTAAPPAPPPPPSAVPPPPRPAGPASGALERVLEAWRVRPFPALVPAALTLSEATESPEAAALRVGDKAVPDDRWDAIAARGRPEDRGALCATFHRGSLGSMTHRVKVVRSWGPDPRVAALVHGLLRAPPFRSTGSQPVWGKLFEAALAHPDPLTLAVVRETARSEFPSGGSMKAWIAAKMESMERALVAAGAADIADPDPLPDWLPTPGPAPAAPAVVARNLPPPTLPRSATAADSVTGGSGVVHALRRSPSGRWAAAWVLDPEEHAGWGARRTAAIAPLVPGTPVSASVPAPGLPVFALGHAPGTLARVVGAAILVRTGRADRAYAVPGLEPGADEEEPSQAKTTVVALAFGAADRELFVVCAVPAAPGSRAAEHVWWLLDLVDGGWTEVTRTPEGYEDRDSWRTDRAWCSPEALTLVTARTCLRWDRAWGALSQAFSTDLSLRATGDGVRLALPHADASVVVDLETGLGRPAPAGVVDVLGADVVVRTQTPARLTGPARRLGPDGAERVVVALPPKAITPVLAFGEGLLVPEGPEVLHVGTGERHGWAASFAGAVAASATVTAIAVGSRILVSRGAARSVHDEDAVVRAVAVAPDGTVYAARGKSLRALPPKGKPRVLTGHAFAVNAVAVGTGGVVSAGDDHLVIAWAPDGTVRHRLSGHPGPVRHLAVPGDGGRVASVGDDGAVRIFDLVTGALLGERALPGATGPLAWDADGVSLAWLTVDGLAWDGGAAALGARPTALASHPDRSLVVVATEDGALHAVLRDGRARTLLERLSPAPTALAFRPDGALVVGAAVPGELGCACVVGFSWEAR